MIVLGGVFLATFPGISAAAPLSAPALPDTTSAEQAGKDALSKILDSFGSLNSIKTSLKSVTGAASTGGGFLSILRNDWVSFKQWFEDRISISLRTILQFIGYVFIFVAVLWIKIIR